MFEHLNFFFLAGLRTVYTEHYHLWPFHEHGFSCCRNTKPKMANQIFINKWVSNDHFAGGPTNLKGIDYIDLLFCHNHPLTKLNIWAKFEQNRWFELSPSAWLSHGHTLNDFFLFSVCSQFYPRTTRLNFITCGLSISTITITPTIPARQNEDEKWPKISFWLPREIQLVDQSQCDTELRGTQKITLRIKATCPAAGATEGLKAIIPYIANLHSRVWNSKVNLPTIWVCRQMSPISDLQSVFDNLRYSF